MAVAAEAGVLPHDVHDVVGRIDGRGREASRPKARIPSSQELGDGYRRCERQAAVGGCLGHLQVLASDELVVYDREVPVRLDQGQQALYVGSGRSHCDQRAPRLSIVVGVAKDAGSVRREPAPHEVDATEERARRVGVHCQPVLVVEDVTAVVGLREHRVVPRPAAVRRGVHPYRVGAMVAEREVDGGGVSHVVGAERGRRIGAPVVGPAHSLAQPGKVPAGPCVATIARCGEP